MTLTLTRSEKTLGGVYLLLQVLLIPFAVTALCMALGNPSEALINLICFFCNALLALVFFRRLLVRSWRNAARDWKRTLAVTAKGFGLYWAINLLITAAILALRPDFANANDAGVNATIDEYPVLMTVAVIFAAPLAEECLFRGWIFTGLAQKRVPLAYGVSCGLFAAAHLVGYVGSYDGVSLLLCLLQYIGPSFVLCRICREADSLAAPLLLHMLINTLGCIFLR